MEDINDNSIEDICTSQWLSFLPQKKLGDNKDDAIKKTNNVQKEHCANNKKSNSLICISNDFKSISLKNTIASNNSTISLVQQQTNKEFFKKAKIIPEITTTFKQISCEMSKNREKHLLREESCNLKLGHKNTSNNDNKETSNVFNSLQSKAQSARLALKLLTRTVNDSNEKQNLLESNTKVKSSNNLCENEESKPCNTLKLFSNNATYSKEKKHILESKPKVNLDNLCDNKKSKPCNTLKLSLSNKTDSKEKQNFFEDNTKVNANNFCAKAKHKSYNNLKPLSSSATNSNEKQKSMESNTNMKMAYNLCDNEKSSCKIPLAHSAKNTSIQPLFIIDRGSTNTNFPKDPRLSSKRRHSNYDDESKQDKSLFETNHLLKDPRLDSEGRPTKKLLPVLQDFLIPKWCKLRSITHAKQILIHQQKNSDILNEKSLSLQSVVDSRMNKTDSFQKTYLKYQPMFPVSENINNPFQSISKLEEHKTIIKTSSFSSKGVEKSFTPLPESKTCSSNYCKNVALSSNMCKDSAVKEKLISSTQKITMVCLEKCVSSCKCTNRNPIKNNIFVHDSQKILLPSCKNNEKSLTSDIKQQALANEQTIFLNTKLNDTSAVKQCEFISTSISATAQSEKFAVPLSQNHITNTEKTFHHSSLKISESSVVQQNLSVSSSNNKIRQSMDLSRPTDTSKTKKVLRYFTVESDEFSFNPKMSEKPLKLEMSPLQTENTISSTDTKEKIDLSEKQHFSSAKLKNCLHSGKQEKTLPLSFKSDEKKLKHKKLSFMDSNENDPVKKFSNEFAKTVLHPPKETLLLESKRNVNWKKQIPIQETPSLQIKKLKSPMDSKGIIPAQQLPISNLGDTSLQSEKLQIASISNKIQSVKRKISSPKLVTLQPKKFRLSIDSKSKMPLKEENFASASDNALLQPEKLAKTIDSIEKMCARQTISIPKLQTPLQHKFKIPIKESVKNQTFTPDVDKASLQFKIIKSTNSKQQHFTPTSDKVQPKHFKMPIDGKQEMSVKEQDFNSTLDDVSLQSKHLKSPIIFKEETSVKKSPCIQNSDKASLQPKIKPSIDCTERSAKQDSSSTKFHNRTSKTTFPIKIISSKYYKRDLSDKNPNSVVNKKRPSLKKSMNKISPGNKQFDSKIKCSTFCQNESKYCRSKNKQDNPGLLPSQIVSDDSIKQTQCEPAMSYFKKQNEIAGNNISMMESLIIKSTTPDSVGNVNSQLLKKLPLLPTPVSEKNFVVKQKIKSSILRDVNKQHFNKRPRFTNHEFKNSSNKLNNLFVFDPEREGKMPIEPFLLSSDGKTQQTRRTLLPTPKVQFQKNTIPYFQTKPKTYFPGNYVSHSFKSTYWNKNISKAHGKETWYNRSKDYKRNRTNSHNKRSKFLHYGKKTYNGEGKPWSKSQCSFPKFNYFMTKTVNYYYSNSYGQRLHSAPIKHTSKSKIFQYMESKRLKVNSNRFQSNERQEQHCKKKDLCTKISANSENNILLIPDPESTATFENKKEHNMKKDKSIIVSDCKHTRALDNYRMLLKETDNFFSHKKKQISLTNKDKFPKKIVKRKISFQSKIFYKLRLKRAIYFLTHKEKIKDKILKILQAFNKQTIKLGNQSLNVANIQNCSKQRNTEGKYIHPSNTEDKIYHYKNAQNLPLINEQQVLQSHISNKKITDNSIKCLAVTQAHETNSSICSTVALGTKKMLLVSFAGRVLLSKLLLNIFASNINRQLLQKVKLKYGEIYEKFCGGFCWENLMISQSDLIQYLLKDRMIKYLIQHCNRNAMHIFMQLMKAYFISNRSEIVLSSNSADLEKIALKLLQNLCGIKIKNAIFLKQSCTPYVLSNAEMFHCFLRNNACIKVSSGKIETPDDKPSSLLSINVASKLFNHCMTLFENSSDISDLQQIQPILYDTRQIVTNVSDSSTKNLLQNTSNNCDISSLLNNFMYQRNETALNIYDKFLEEKLPNMQIVPVVDDISFSSEQVIFQNQSTFTAQKLFYSNCSLKNKKFHTLTDFKEDHHPNFNMFEIESNSVYQLYYKHLKETGCHELYIDNITNDVTHISEEYFESYCFLCDQLKYHKSLLWGLIATSSDPGQPNDPNLSKRISLQLNYIKGYELACKVLLI